MLNGNYTIKKVIGGRNFYGEITIEASVLDRNNLIIEYDHEIFKEWGLGIEFGINYFHSNFSNDGIFVKITHARGQIVDTTQVLMSFIVIKALEEVFNYKMHGCTFDELIGVVSFKH